MPGLSIPTTLFASNYLHGVVWHGSLHVAAGVLGFTLLLATLALILNARPPRAYRPRFVANRPVLEH